MRDGDCIKLEGKTREKMVWMERVKNNQKMSGSEEKKVGEMGGGSRYCR